MASGSAAAEERTALLNDELARAVRILSGDPSVREVWVFGSLARGHANARSDLDLIVVQRTRRKFLNRLDEMYRRIVPRVACDFLVYTPKEFERMRRESSLVSRAVREGRRVYAARQES